MNNNLVPTFEHGTSVGNKPEGIEELATLRYGNANWVKIIEALKIIDTMKCVQLDLTGKPKYWARYARVQIKKYAEKLKFKPIIKFAVKGDVLYVWTNK